jgi:hypothetical protein
VPAKGTIRKVFCNPLGKKQLRQPSGRSYVQEKHLLLPGDNGGPEAVLVGQLETQAHPESLFSLDPPEVSSPIWGVQADISPYKSPSKL